ncbi:uncharacterized protein LOC133182845 [Saccostrea echinata]|uniref:uncharacterized protein LOC133182845 n=1 Tax=Saccostrea echinata TaxID=191078 RepID=UPI002A80991A|nr:uncharacterized protein LOC133182845 [Saccostrea echinata]
MADPVANVIDMNGTHVLENGTIISTQDIDGSVVTGVEVTDEDIIQQALDEATGTFVQSGMGYASGTDPEARVEEELIASVVTSEAFVTADEINGDRDQLVTDDASNTAFDGTTNDSINDQLVNAFSESVAQSEDSYSNTEYAIVKNEADFATATMTAVTLPNQGLTTGDTNVSSDSMSSTVQNNVLKLDSASGRISVTLMPSNQASGAPLGSSQNPIRIIQQGNQYTPMQNLSTEQLQQIMQVVQQQQVTKTSSEEGSSILFNPQTNTRIVYRVIYPSELHKNAQSSTLSLKTVGARKHSQGQQTQTLILGKDGQRRPYRKRTIEDEEDRLDGPDLSREEKEERKKHRPRTRSGRISKPPKHMVKDYKHIHVLDFEEEEAADDSDGGYSDYKYSEGEEEEDDHVILDDQDENSLDMGLPASGKPKKFQCSVCNKAYIGQGSLERHYRLNPDHAPDGQQMTTQGSYFGSVSHNGFSNAGNMSEDSNTQDSTSSTPPRPPSTRGYFQRRGGSRGRPPGPNSAIRRRSKLKELISSCSDEDLIDLVLPRIAKVFTLWDFLLLKVQKGVPRRPHADIIYNEFKTLAKEVKEVCKTFLQPCTEKSQNTLKLEDEKLAGAVGLDVGVYEIKEMPAIQESVTFPDNAAMTVNSVNTPVKRNLSTVIKEEISSPAKKFKPTMSAAITSSSSSSSLSSQNSSNSNTFPIVNPSSTTITNKKITISTSDAAISSLGRSSTQPPIVIHPISPSTMSKAVAKVKSQGTAALSSTLNSQKLLISQSQPSAPIIVQSVPARSRNQPTIASGSPVVVQNVPQPIFSGGVSLLNKVNKAPIISPAGETKIVRIVSPEGLVISEAPISKTSTETPHQDSESTKNNVTSTPSVVIQDNSIVENLTVIPSESVTLQTTDNSVSTLPTTSADIQITNNDEESFVTTDFIGSTPDGSENLMTAEVVSENGSAQVVDETSHVMAEVESSMNDGLQNQEELTQLVDESTLEEAGFQTNQIITASNIYQTPDGFIIIQNEDGSTVQLQGGDGEPIPLETVQALLAMDTDGQTILQTTESELIPE